MKFQVNIYLDGKVVDPSSYQDVSINNKIVNMIVNDIVDAINDEPKDPNVA